jgi:hypothetical protein
VEAAYVKPKLETEQEGVKEEARIKRADSQAMVIAHRLA